MSGQQDKHGGRADGLRRPVATSWALRMWVVVAFLGAFLGTELLLRSVFPG